VLVKQFDYTGWTCRADAPAAACSMVSDGSGDIVRAQVGPGRQRIDLVPETLQERAGKIASVAGAAADGDDDRGGRQAPQIWHQACRI
jgi:hypothetical protein